MFVWFQVRSKVIQLYKHAHVHLFFFSYPFPLWVSIRYWAGFPGLDSRSLLVLHVKSSSVSMSIPHSLTIPSPILPPGDRKVITEYWANFPVLSSRSLSVTYFICRTVCICYSQTHHLFFLSPLFSLTKFVFFFKIYFCFILEGNSCIMLC